MSEPVYPFVCIDVPAELADVAASQLFELGALGVEQRDATTLARGEKSPKKQVDFGSDVGVPIWSDEGPAADAGEVVTLVAAFADHEAAHEAMQAFDAELNPRLEEVIGDAWRDAWKEHFEPFRFTTHLVVQPPWKRAERAMIDEVPGTHVLDLEPGRAFGTGLHATTALVAQALDDRREALKNKEILDVGCGSGILSIAALALGAKSARAIDVDPDAVRVTMENAERAGFAQRLHADDSDMAKIDRVYPIVLANIQAEVLIPRANDLMARVAKGGLLVLSGILVSQREAVRAAYGAMKEIDAPVRGEWIALVLEKDK